MMKTLARTLLTMVAGLLWNGLVHAEGGFCPPGSIDHNNGRAGAIVCSPIPGYGQQQAPQQPATQWESRWGAIATSVPDGILGVATDKRSKQEASQVAVQDCQSKGGLNCKIKIPYDNQCAAIVVGDGGYNASSAITVDRAVELGMKTCRDGGLANCHTYYTACSLPARIR
ncbi:DUF4189 domain-containing protein [Variovorax paradoxus]|uniref:DUF4189 domain-containing protein n=1 Tax=Variovorax paradoxus TaxID=34073 RepID=UPI00278006CC|nr:DUF4189 domain-containing protein [Variovorax paradoxus]MDP9930067.1 hypothetical protein [Variovorax paradoxus]